MSTDDPPFSTTTTATSPLDKPLHQLTEDDISQLTREDCRRYLKQKGPLTLPLTIKGFLYL